MPTTKSNVFFLLYFAASVCLRGGVWRAGVGGRRGEDGCEGWRGGGKGGGGRVRVGVDWGRVPIGVRGRAGAWRVTR